ncbi:Flp family type IVb pilin [Novipirellula artificiosorum]|uniref:Flp/Fap pilin component n=1 Tax=Novipirellula artificiosorum TaxID=2528016 RepID=A0A5C6E3A7_9BACT|nr:Flp family type IVb pilin [Novipirellula artificiosorum]TWU42121.1 Flp/Fap pilin component [Novipirellula artificiosorum]
MTKATRLSGIIAFLSDEDAATAIEYAVMLALIIGVCAGSVSFLATQTKDSFDTSGAAINGAIGS